MSLEESIASRLSNEKGFVSGEKLANELGVSRAAIWKAVSNLRSQGIDVAAVRNKGYLLETPYDAIGEESLAQALGQLGCMVDIEYLKKVGSTNDIAKGYARSSATARRAVVAGMQTAGRGRRGRAFYSPFGCGVYLTTIVSGREIPADPQMLTIAAAVAVCQAVEQAVGASCDIKWVNDVYLGGRKVCGILTEAEIDLETGRPAWAVVGIGINVYEPQGGWPEDLKGKVGAVANEARQGLRARLAAATIAAFYHLVDDFEDGQVLDEYRSRSNLIGRDADVSFEGVEERRVRIVGITDDLKLLCRDANNEHAPIEELSSIDTSISLLVS